MGPSIESLVDALRPDQRAAVLADNPVVCLVAGAGAGKTRVLTLRVARRIADGSAHPRHVLVCTFSRKAADELRDRLWSLGVGADVHAGTFHRTALRLIRQYRADRRLRPPVVVPDRRALLAAVLDDTPGGAAAPTRSDRRVRRPAGAAGGAGGASRAGRSRRGPAVARAEAEIAWAKSRLLGPSDYDGAAEAARRRPPGGVARMAELYARYEEVRKRRGVLDLDDLLGHCAEVLDRDPSYARAVRWQYRHLYVDEMQDLNEAQFQLLCLLAGEEPDLFCVGDPAQSVYGWNGADAGLLDRVPEVFFGTHVLRLTANHRCSPQVVAAATAVLADDAGAVSTRADGPLPRVVGFETDAHETTWVARQVWLAHRPGRRWASIAVLARTNAQLGALALALQAERVPYRLAGADLAPASDVVVGEDTSTGSSSVAPEDVFGPGAEVIEDAVDDDSEPPGGRGGAGNPVDPHSDAVVLSTFHRAKGLQWPAVFVVGLSEGLVPLVSARSRAALDEERRLLYVALSRAEDELTCSWAERSSPDAAPRRPSRWLEAVERAVEGLRSGDGDGAGPERAAEHLDRLRQLLRSVT